MAPGNYLVVSRPSAHCGRILGYTPCESLYAVAPDGELVGDLAVGPGLSYSSLSPTGHTIAFYYPNGYEGDSISHVIMIDLLDLTQTQVDLPLTRAFGIPVWSPDGSRLMLGLGNDVQLLDPTVPSVEVVLVCSTLWEEEGPECDPLAWSPDGKWVALDISFNQSGPVDPREGLYLLDADCLLSLTSCPPTMRRISDYQISASWSPDSRHLAFGDYRGTVTVFDIASGSSIAVDTPGYLNGVSWSPDGECIAFSSDRARGMLSTDTLQLTPLSITWADEYTRFPFWLTVP
jgi:WD40 repeat protein